MYWNGILGPSLSYGQWQSLPPFAAGHCGWLSLHQRGEVETWALCVVKIGVKAAHGPLVVLSVGRHATELLHFSCLQKSNSWSPESNFHKWSRCTLSLPVFVLQKYKSVRGCLIVFGDVWCFPDQAAHHINACNQLAVAMWFEAWTAAQCDKCDVNNVGCTVQNLCVRLLVQMPVNEGTLVDLCWHCRI